MGNTFKRGDLVEYHGKAVPKLNYGQFGRFIKRDRQGWLHVNFGLTLGSDLRCAEVNVRHASATLGRICWQTGKGELYGRIELYQRGVDRFAVAYGVQVERVNYHDACAKLGQAIMHALACDSIIDNREPGER